MHILFTLIFLFYSLFFYSQEVSPAIKKDNHQKQISGQLLALVSELSDEIKETSGLALYKDYLITHNDRKNKNFLYFLNKETGKIKSKIEVEGAENIDWEDLTQNNDHLFIADIGNNDGNRRDLKIYKIKKSDLKIQDGKKFKVDGIIELTYPDQTNFSSRKNHNFDGEAIVFLNDFLYIFSKSRQGDVSKVYKIPAKAGKYTAKLIDKIEISGSITGAALSPSNNLLALVGYNKNSDCFVYLIQDFQTDHFSSGKKSKISLGSFKQLGQTEGIVFEGNQYVYISSEKTKNVNARLYKLKLVSKSDNLN
jgi:hypothetical protein